MDGQISMNYFEKLLTEFPGVKEVEIQRFDKYSEGATGLKDNEVKYRIFFKTVDENTKVYIDSLIQRLERAIRHGHPFHPTPLQDIPQEDGWGTRAVRQQELED